MRGPGPNEWAAGPIRWILAPMADPSPIGIERVALVVALLGQAVGAGIAGTAGAIFGDVSGLALTCFIVAGVACPVAAIALVVAGGSGGGGTASRGIVWAMVAIETAFIAAILRDYSMTLSDPFSFAPIAMAIAWPLALSGGCAAIVFGLLRALARDTSDLVEERSPRRPNRLVVAGAGAVAALLLGGSAVAFAAARGDLGCEVFEFDETAWRDGGSDIDPVSHHDPRRLQARALSRCGVLEGKTRGEVRELLGGGERARSYDLGPTGWIFSYEVFELRYGEDGRVTDSFVKTYSD